MHQVKRLIKQVGIWMISKIHWSLILKQLTKKVNKTKCGGGIQQFSYFRKKKTDKIEKHRNQKHPKKQSLPTKQSNLTHLTRYINQGLPQEIIYLIKVLE